MINSKEENCLETTQEPLTSEEVCQVCPPLQGDPPASVHLSEGKWCLMRQANDLDGLLHRMA